MRKTIAIGESILDTVFLDDRPIDSFVGGRIANAAASVGEVGIPVEMVSECCNDHIGDIITGFLRQHHVGTGSVDRFTEGGTAAAIGAASSLPKSSFCIKILLFTLNFKIHDGKCVSM